LISPARAGDFRFYLRYDCSVIPDKKGCDEACEKHAVTDCFAASKQWMNIGLGAACVTDKRQTADSCQVQPAESPHITPFIVYCKIKSSNCSEITDYGCLRGFSERPGPYPSATPTNMYAHVSAEICVAPIPTPKPEARSGR
jgi:hypothetical protein